MAKKYAYNKEESEDKQTARAMARSLKVSPKHCVDICSAIRGMDVQKAKKYLNDVIDMKQAVPFKKHNKKVGHRKGMKGWSAGRYPVKAAAAVLRVLENAEANAEYKGMVIRGAIPRAFGRVTPFNTPTTHIQIVLMEA